MAEEKERRGVALARKISGSCPECGSKNVQAHARDAGEGKAGFHQCVDCGAHLARQRRGGGGLFDDGGVVYVAAGRSGVQVHGTPGPLTTKEIVVDYEEPTG